MDFLQIKCPNCGATLSIENGLDLFYCSHCGSKLLLNGQSSSTVNAKANIVIVEKLIDQKRYEMDAEERERRRKEEKEEKEKRQIRRDNIIGYPLIILFFAALFYIMFLGVKSDKAKQATENQRLETIYSEIQIDVQNGDYQTALIKANSLRYLIDTNHSSDDKYRALWDERRQELIEMIKTIQNNS